MSRPVIITLSSNGIRAINLKNLDRIWTEFVSHSKRSSCCIICLSNQKLLPLLTAISNQTCGVDFPPHSIPSPNPRCRYPTSRPLIPNTRLHFRNLIIGPLECPQHIANSCQDRIYAPSTALVLLQPCLWNVNQSTDLHRRLQTWPPHNTSFPPRRLPA